MKPFKVISFILPSCALSFVSPRVTLMKKMNSELFDITNSLIAWFGRN